MPRTASSSDGRFKFVGGDVALDFVNTVDWTTAGPVNDRLEDARAFAAWAFAAGLLGRSEEARLAKATAGVAETKLLRRVRQVRRVLKALFDSLGAATPGAATADAFSAELRRAMAHVDFDAGRAPGSARLRFRGVEPWDPVLDAVVYAAVQLATSPEATRVRVCAGRDCGWIYVDRSRNGLRRWCEMSTCGARQKARAYYRRKRAATARDV